MTKQELPECSQLDCTNAAGIIMNGELLCGAHVNEALDRRRAELQRRNSGNETAENGNGA